MGESNQNCDENSNSRGDNNNTSPLFEEAPSGQRAFDENTMTNNRVSNQQYNQRYR